MAPFHIKPITEFAALASPPAPTARPTDSLFITALTYDIYGPKLTRELARWHASWAKYQGHFIV